jgi:hypothetical protein
MVRATIWLSPAASRGLAQNLNQTSPHLIDPLPDPTALRFHWLSNSLN